MTDDWESHLPLVPAVIRAMRDAGELPGAVDPDDYQVGYLAIGEAMPRHEPGRGALSTFLWAAVRGAILDQRAQDRAGGTGRRAPWRREPLGVTGDGSLDEQMAAAALFSDRPGCDSGPLDSLLDAATGADVEYGLSLLGDDDRGLLVAVFGLDGARMTLADYARLTGTPVRTAEWRKRRALDRMAAVMMD